MVWFHGGGFVVGSSDTSVYGPGHLLDRNVVLVTANYRLGVLGFLTLGRSRFHESSFKA
jgi:carboxylesterase type B